MSQTIYADFKRAQKGETPESFGVQSIRDLEQELQLPGLAEAYNTMTETNLMTVNHEGSEITVSVIPHDEHIFESIRDKGFRLRVAEKAPDAAPYHFEIFFEEMAPGMLRQNGFYRPRDEHGGMLYPKLVNESLKAIVRKLIEYRPKVPQFGQDSGPVPMV